MRTFIFMGFFAALISACGQSAAPTAPAIATPVVTTPAPPASDVPVISNITANFSTNSCTRAADGWTGRALVISFDYTDGSGDLNGGSVVLNRLYDTGRSESHTSLIPSGVTLTGTQTAGRLTISNACPLYDNASSTTETLTLVDANGFSSNSLSAPTTRPAGAP